jgi:pyruvate kinase
MGPACANETVLESMLQNGMNVARFNMSHGDHTYHKDMMTLFRSVRDRLHYPAAILLDTKGPEIRLKDFENGKVTLKKGETFTLTAKDCLGDQTRCAITYADLPKVLNVGVRILMDDGRVALKVTELTDTDIVCRVEVGGTVSNHKGINVPNTPLHMPYLSDQDKEDLKFAVEMDVDFIAASFVRSKEDVIAMRKFLNYYGGHRIRIIAKIENTEGIEHFDEILKHADGIMIARGDMGVEVEFERLPGLQKQFIRKCYQSGKMVITATQMLESMITANAPTRAEITDVANAVFDGTSAVMLSGETAVGAHPALVVKVMAKIARQAEKDAFAMQVYSGIRYDSDCADLTNAICDAAVTTARDLDATAIIAVTKSGTTARRVSKFRPSQPIIAATPDEKTFHQLSLSWGVSPVSSLSQADTEHLFQHAIDCAKQIDCVQKGDKVVITAGVPLNFAGTTNLIKVQFVE